MIVLSLVLVIIAAVTLVLGVFQDGLLFIYVSIGTCLAAMVLLGIGVLMRRREETEPAPASSGYGARPEAASGSGSTPTQQPAPQEDAVQVRQSTDTQRLGEAREQRPAAATGEVRPAKKAVVKKVSAGVAGKESRAGADDAARDEPPTRPFEPRSDEPAARAVAQPGDRDAAEGSDGEDAAPAKQAVVTGAPAKKAAAKKTATKKATTKKTATKKAATKKAAAKKSTKKAAAKKSTKKAATKKSTKKAAAKKATKKASASAATSMPDIKGLGPAKANALLERFGSVEGIRDADLSEITEIKGIGDGLARQLKRELGG